MTRMTMSSEVTNSQAIVRLMAVSSNAARLERAERIRRDKPLEGSLADDLLITNPIMWALAGLAAVDASSDGWLTRQWKRIRSRFPSP
jgi:hypothetical protein